MSGTFYFDIETAPPNDEQLNRWFDWEDQPAPIWDEDAYKLTSDYTGVKKDETKARRLAAAKEKHDDQVKSWDAVQQRERDDAWDDLKSKAMLDPSMGVVCAIGVMEHDEVDNPIALTLTDMSEEAILKKWWALVQHCQKSDSRLVGHNIQEFDLPWLIVRSWVNEVQIPANVMPDKYGKFPHVFVDSAASYLLGAKGKWAGRKYSLDHLSKTFGFEGKTGDGKEFYKLLSGTDEERAAAMNYLINDLKMTRSLCIAIGIA